MDNHNINDLVFEDALAELERIVRALDAGQSSLEASLRDYEKGVRLLRHCHATLQNAERRIEILRAVGPEYRQGVNPDGGFVTEQVAESQFLTDATQPGQRKSEPQRKKRVRKAVQDHDVEETNDIPFDFD